MLFLYLSILFLFKNGDDDERGACVWIRKKTNKINCLKRFSPVGKSQKEVKGVWG
jgi:hypothetical protein